MAISFLAPNHLRDRGKLELYADNEYYSIVEFQVLDTNGTPAVDGTTATIDDQNDGRNLAATDNDTPGSGRIVYISDGVGKFKLLPSIVSQSFTLTISVSGQSDLTASIDYNDPTVNVYVVSSYDEDDPQWIDGIATADVRVTIASDYYDINGIEFSVNNRPIVVTYVDEFSVSHTLNLTTNASGVVEQTFGPLTAAFTYEVSTAVNFSFVAGKRTMTIDEDEEVDVVFSRIPIVSLTITPSSDYNTPFNLWADGRTAIASQETFGIKISYDYDDTYFSSAQFDTDNPVGVSVAFSVYDDDGALSVAVPTSGVYTAAASSINVVIGPAIKTTDSTFRSLITNSFYTTFGLKTLIHNGNIQKEFDINFVEPTFTMEIEFNVGETPNNPTTLDDDLFPTGSKKTGDEKTDLGGVRAFADDSFKYASKIIISSDYNDIAPDQTNLINKSIKFESQRCDFDAFNSLVDNFDPNNDSNSFLGFVSSAAILDASGNPQDTVYNTTTYSVSDDEISTYVTLNKQPSVGDKTIYIKIDAATSFNYTFGSRALDVDNISVSGIVTDFPAAPQVSLDIQHHSDDPDDEDNKLPADQSQYLFSLVREDAIDSSGAAVQPTAQPEPRRRPGIFTITATDYLGNALPSNTTIIIRTNDFFAPIEMADITSYVNRVCKFVFDNRLEMKDSLYMTVETTHNDLYRSVTEQIPYFNNTDKEFYTKDIFMRNINSITNGFTNSLDVLNAGMGDLGIPFGQTPFYEAVFDSAIDYLDELRDETFDNKFIVVLTDAIDNFSKVTSQEAIDKVNSVEGENEVRIYPIALGDTSYVSQSILGDYAADTDSYTDTLLQLNQPPEIEEIINIIMNYNYKRITSSVRTFNRDFKEVIRMSNIVIDLTIPNGYELYLQARSNSISLSQNSTDWSTWTSQQQLTTGSNVITFDSYLVGRYFEFKVRVIPNDLEV